MICSILCFSLSEIKRRYRQGHISDRIPMLFGFSFVQVSVAVSFKLIVTLQKNIYAVVGGFECC